MYSPSALDDEIESWAGRDSQNLAGASPHGEPGNSRPRRGAQRVSGHVLTAGMSGQLAQQDSTSLHVLSSVHSVQAAALS